MSSKIDNRKWTTPSPGERIKQIEVVGYLVLLDLLLAEQLDTLRARQKA